MSGHLIQQTGVRFRETCIPQGDVSKPSSDINSMSLTLTFTMMFKYPLDRKGEKKKYYNGTYVSIALISILRLSRVNMLIERW